MSPFRRFSMVSYRLSATLLGALSFPLLAQTVEVPLRNWTVPPYTQSASGGGISTMTDVTAPRAFVGVRPCRVADTRGFGFTGQAGPGAIENGRTFQIAGTVPGVPEQCGIPSGAAAVSFQFTIVTPTGAGNLIAWPGGVSPTSSVLNWDAGVTAVGNGTIVPISASGSLNVRINAASSGVTAYLVIDVNGYFAETPDNQSSTFQVTTSSTEAAVEITNNSTTCIGACGIYAVTSGGHGIVGTSVAGGATYGVGGRVTEPGPNAAGVFGFDDDLPLTTPSYNSAGVRGHSQTNGVLGLSEQVGVGGYLVNGTTELAYGLLGFKSGMTNYGVFSGGPTGGTGAITSADPHPTEASKVIRYTSLLGNEPGTYFRGKAKFERGMARITVPEDFRMMTDPEGITVQVTPIGPLATVSVVRFDLNEIVVQSSRNVEFFYTVNGIRRTHKDGASPIAEGTDYMPRTPESKMPAYLTEAQKQLLVQNGTYREDGSVNMETARKLGWDRVWAERERPETSPSE
jgi:hypothetical protein